ncbi:hypothetical protein ALQ95_102014 [Pseudomonas syringae pv. ribicola]|uniref:Uncharacterized protein n=1 Tax=Pseudomonas syringae pv. ribicola TaxID=55398 RepID=A0A3M2VYR2_PSESI|nr:hypothetical protein ALQ95_102014 [Pseudomonas syringae pv. ribicola]
MAAGREATGTNCTDITQTKYADTHRILLDNSRHKVGWILILASRCHTPVVTASKAVELTQAY